VGWAGERAPGSQRVLTPQTKKNSESSDVCADILAAASSDYVTYPIDPNAVARNDAALHPELSCFEQGVADAVLPAWIWSLNDDALPSVQSSVQSRI
jgi:hypothetical protein